MMERFSLCYQPANKVYKLEMRFYFKHLYNSLEAE